MALAVLGVADRGGIASDDKPTPPSSSQLIFHEIEDNDAPDVFNNYTKKAAALKLLSQRRDLIHIFRRLPYMREASFASRDALIALTVKRDLSLFR